MLRQQDAALRQDGEHAVRVREARARPHLRRDGRECGHVLGKRALCHHELGVRKRKVVVVAVRLCEEVQVAQVRLDERVELARRVVSRVELAQQVREHADVREVLKVERAEVEVQVRVVDSVRGQVVVQAGERSVHPLQRRVRGRGADVGRGEARQRRQGLRAVRGLLLAAQRLDLAGHGRKVLWRHGALAGKELVLLGRARALLRRHQLHLAAVGRVAHELAQQALEVAVAQAGAHVGHLIFVAQVVHGAGVVVQPAGHRLHGQRHAVRVRSPVALAQVELALGKRRLELGAVDAVRREPCARVLHQLAEAPRHAGLCALQLKQHLRLQLAVHEGRREVVAEVRVEHRALERCLVRARERVQQHVRREHALAVRRGPNDVRKAHAGVLRRGGHGDLPKRRTHGRLQRQRVWRAGAAVRGRVKAAAHKREHVLYVQVAVQDGVAVRQVVVARVRVDELLVRKLRNVARVSAGLEAVRRVRKQALVHGLKQHLVRVAQGSLHLVEDDAVVRKARARVCGRGCVSVRVLKLQVPALLLEDARPLVDGGVEHRVQVHVHQVLQVRGVRGRHGVHRLVRKRQRVQKRLHGRLQQVHERLLHREALAAAQDGVLQDVEHARAVGGRRLERYGEGLLVVVDGDPHGPGAGCVVTHDVGGAGKLRQR